MPTQTQQRQKGCFWYEVLTSHQKGIGTTFESSQSERARCLDCYKRYQLSKISDQTCEDYIPHNKLN